MQFFHPPRTPDSVKTFKTMASARTSPALFLNDVYKVQIGRYLKAVFIQ